MKKHQLELAIYKALGIKTFKKLILKIPEMLTSAKIKTSRKTAKQDSSFNLSNYHINQNKKFEGLEDFKKELFFNSFGHGCILFLALPGLMEILAGTSSPILTIITLLNIIINSYCLILQRYNYIRINEVLAKYLEYQAKKEELEKNILEYAKSLQIESFTLKKSEKVTNLSSEELLKTLSREDLKILFNYLNSLKDLPLNPELNIPLSNSELTLELKKANLS